MGQGAPVLDPAATDWRLSRCRRFGYSSELNDRRDQIMAALGRFFILIAALIFGGEPMAADLENTIYMDVPAGRVVIEMRPDLAPATCAPIKALVRWGFYDGIVFHPVIRGFSSPP